MNLPKSYALHQIHHPEVFGFDPNAYSRFKFGDDLVAKAFGEQLANGFITDYLQDNLITNQIVVISSPYSFIPTATFAMKNYFIYQLNHWLVENGGLVVQEAKVHRTVTYKEDYGALSAQERMKLIGNDSFQIDKQFLEDKTLLFLDDIRITGSHERMILKMAEEYKLTNDIHLLYFAELANMDIHPNVENVLNYHYVKSIFDLEDIIKAGSFCFNTRIVKYILNSDSGSFSIFIKNQTEYFINMLYNLALGNGYHTIAAYAANLEDIRKHIIKKKYKLI
ncbi:phosphoribosyltransferase family protein [Pedobacter sp. L105]|uniref:phosphoribosyltransferase family protein n=1 Tax=Pedobacter sp. L105 TaxID=1641871 RepID=UPI00131B16D9|nr:phosphoribosyltransferase family protein [Pedobacter sp. L105]